MQITKCNITPLLWHSISMAWDGCLRNIIEVERKRLEWLFFTLAGSIMSHQIKLFIFGIYNKWRILQDPMCMYYSLFIITQLHLALWGTQFVPIAATDCVLDFTMGLASLPLVLLEASVSVARFWLAWSNVCGTLCSHTTVLCLPGAWMAKTRSG